MIMHTFPAYDRVWRFLQKYGWWMNATSSSRNQWS